jgi:uncharacterized protein YndB with AHSA1/START domain
MLSIILIVIITAVTLVLVLAAGKPDEFRVQRSISIDAPAARIFESIDSFHRWPTWSPWEKMDPAMQRTHSGATSGKGAIYEWQGNNKVGQGRMEIMESNAPRRIVIKLDFLKPFEAHNTAEFILTPQGDERTDVSWAMSGPTPFIGKIMHVFMNMDKMVGKDFATGLANLKTVNELAQ